MPRDQMVPSLLRAFARHRNEADKPIDYWLPPEVYDPTLWSPDSVYLYIITDGCVGAPAAVDAANRFPLKDCEVCRPGAPRDDGVHAAVVEGFCGSRSGVLTLAALLEELDLGHLAASLSGLNIKEADAELVG